MLPIFDRDKHIYKSNAFDEIIKDTIRFFNGTPVLRLPPPERFSGTGIYALYYVGASLYYAQISDKNRMEFRLPIYVGKAVPEGWRQGRVAKNQTNSYELYRRLKDHAQSIHNAENLNSEDFLCRIMILEEGAENMIGTVEAALIRYYTPIWNTLIDGFGNHDPGKGRYKQAKSDWDILHPGRSWAAKCDGESLSLADVEAKLLKYDIQIKHDE